MFDIRFVLCCVSFACEEGDFCRVQQSTFYVIWIWWLSSWLIFIHYFIWFFFAFKLFRMQKTHTHTFNLQNFDICCCWIVIFLYFFFQYLTVGIEKTIRSIPKKNDLTKISTRTIKKTNKNNNTLSEMANTKH